MSTSIASETVSESRKKSKRNSHRWLKRGVSGLAIAAFMLAGVGSAYQAIASRNDGQQYLPPGQFVDLDGRRIHMLVMGKETGKPTIILEAGIASFSSNWAWVQTELATYTRVVAVDRAGLGWSDPTTEPQDAQQSAIDLHEVLQKAGISGPYVVAGHSYGGLVVRAFTDLYPQDVTGMVLVDASHPDQWVHIPESKGGRVVAAGNRITGYIAGLGIVRLFDLNAALTTGLPHQPGAELKAFLSRPQAYITSSGVLSIWDQRIRPQFDNAHSLGDLPLGVLSVTEQKRYGDVLTRLQAELTGLSTNSMQITVEGATHESLVAEQNHAAVVSGAILQVMESALSGEPLVVK